MSCHHIDDPLRHHNHLLGRLATERPFYLIEGQNGTLNFGICSIAGNCDFSAFFAVDLHRQRNGIFDQQFRLELRPSLGGDERFAAERSPALLGQVRHHRLEQPYQDIDRFPCRPTIVGGRLSLEVRERGLEGVGELVDMGDAHVEAQPLDVLRDVCERAVGGLAQGERWFAEDRRARQIG